MRVRSILNRVEKHKSLVYERVRWVGFGSGGAAGRGSTSGPPGGGAAGAPDAASAGPISCGFEP